MSWAHVCTTAGLLADLRDVRLKVRTRGARWRLTVLSVGRARRGACARGPSSPRFSRGFAITFSNVSGRKGLEGVVRRRMTPIVAVLLTVLAMLMLTGSLTSASARPASHAHEPVAISSQQSAGTSPASHQTHTLPPVHGHHMKPAVVRHRGGGRPLPGASGHAAPLSQSSDAGLLHPRWARATEAVPGRLATTYPMRT